MSGKKEYGCLMYQDVFERIDKYFKDEPLGRVLRAAYKFGFYGELVTLDDPLEQFALETLMDLFKRNKESYTEQTLLGEIGAAVKHAKNNDDFKERIQNIDGLRPHTQFALISAYQKKKPGESINVRDILAKEGVEIDS